MPGDLRLWTGPYGAGLRDRALEHEPVDSSGLWIVATPLAREQVVRALACRRRVACGLRVWCWDDLWRAVAAGRDREDAPALLSPAGIRAALGETIGRARRFKTLEVVRTIADTPGFRRRLLARFAAWTRNELSKKGPPPDGSPSGQEEWDLYIRYRDVLKTLRAEDPEGFAVWASRSLGRQPSPGLKPLDHVHVLDPTIATPAIRRALEHLRDQAQAVLVTLPWDGDPAVGEAYSGVAELREKLLSWGFAETSFGPKSDRRPGLASVERELFRSDAHERPLLEQTDGLDVVGAPQGEGIGLVVARRVRKLLAEGVGPDDILVLFRHWDDDAALVFETLQAWGIPTSAEPRRPLASAPDVSALALAMDVPVGGWETARLIQLLRNSLFRPDWPDVLDRHAIAATATALREIRVFRGRDALRDALVQYGSGLGMSTVGADETQRPLRAQRARLARPVFDQLIDLFDSIDQPGHWDVQVIRLRRLAASLGLGESADGGDATGRTGEALDDLWNALDDQGAVLAGIGRGGQTWSWAEFAAEVGSITRELTISPTPSMPGTVRLLSVDAAEGARARHILLTNLREGTFPTRESVDLQSVSPLDAGLEEPEPASDDADRPNLAFAHEMLRFLRTFGSADESLDLVYPTTDEKGQRLLPAGFVLDVEARFSTPARDRFMKPIRRLDPALLPADLAGAPRDARLRAVALAFHADDHAVLKVLARSPIHRPALLGAAAALRVAHLRFRRPDQFGAFEGMIRDLQAVAKIAEKFPEFSPSQLESLVFCPFQFFSKYVLKLAPIDERDELEDDRTWRGSLIHQVLERLHLGLRDAPLDASEDTATGVASRITGTIRQVLDQEPLPVSDVERGLREIETARLEQTGRRYAQQFASYVGLPETRIDCHSVETKFGLNKLGESYPGLELGQDGQIVRLRGSIDRIDLVRKPDQTLFRVIDYKTGSCPPADRVQSGLALQLPLYALAVQRLGIVEDEAPSADFGYWALRAKGYKGVGPKDWERFAGRLESFVVAVVGHLRLGAFPIQPREKDCTERCDYRLICRIGQVRAVGKVWADAPRLERDP